MHSHAANTRFSPRVTGSAVLELLKPITWFPPMWAFLCGAVSSGQPFAGHGVAVFFGVLLAGPLVCATSQAVNDWYDREVDAINEPHRPIPSGRIPGKWGLYIGLLWTLFSVIVAGALGPVVLAAASLGLLLAWAYSAPPARLKLNGWSGNAAVGLCYEGLPWITGAAILSVSGVPDSRIFAVALLYSIGAHGIMVLNDFKAMDGDRQLGVRTLPVQLGAARAARVACLFMTGAQIAVVILLFLWQQPAFAIAVVVLIGVQLLLMRRLLTAPRDLAPWYNATGVSLYVLGMLVTAFALRYPSGNSLGA